MTRPGEDSREQVVDVIGFLAQSENRVAVLSALAERGRLDRYELEGAIDATRRTLLRTVDALAERGYVEETDDGIGLTALGDHVVGNYERFVEDVALDPAVETFLASLPAGALGVDVERLRDGEVTTAAPGSPYAPLDRMLELRSAATEVRELAPAIERRSVQQIAERLSDDGLEMEIVITEDVLAAAEGDVGYTDAHERVLAADAVDLAVHPGPFEVALGIMDDVVVIVAEANDGQPSAILETDDPAVRRWAHEVVDRYRSEATSLSPE